MKKAVRCCRSKSTWSFIRTSPRRSRGSFPAVAGKLGQWGRFGNQVFEYAFIKLFGRTHHLRVETSPWVGNQLFGAADPQVHKQFPQHLESTYALKDSKVAQIAFRPFNVDLCGVF